MHRNDGIGWYIGGQTPELVEIIYYQQKNLFLHDQPSNIEKIFNAVTIFSDFGSIATVVLLDPF